MNLFSECLFWIAVVMVSGLILGAVLAWWIGCGESDVNGDPERDSGELPADDYRCHAWMEGIENGIHSPAPIAREVGSLPTLICMDCHLVLREGTEPVSHGLCPICAARRMAQLKTLGITI